MPTTGIHEIVARKIALKYKDYDNYNFYLGCLTPDAVNVDGFAKKDKRWTAHLRDSNLDTWKDNVEKFYNEQKENYDNSFITGYATHVMTDIIYDEYLYDEVTNKIAEDAYHMYMLDDMNIYAYKNDDYKYVKGILSSKDTYYDIRNINKALLNRWKDKVINEKPVKPRAEYITDEVLEKLTDLTLKELENRKII